MASRPTWFGNGFSYGNSNPANLADPTGLCSFYSALSCGDDIWNAVSSAFRDTVDAARAAGSAIAAGAGWTADRIVAIAEGAAAIATSGIGQLANASGAIGQALWHLIRQTVNRQLSDMALAFAAARGLNCRSLRNGLTGCFGASFLDGSAMTLGNVILIKDKQEISDELLSHEEWHANQWAWFGLATGDPLVGQAVMAASYVAIDQKFGPCYSPYDWQAGWADGGYTQCLD
ncbi:MAG: hypothetical protein IPF51_02295 [Dehalococcoidia bacterium]|nr:hypothetical protein [Dehalococcoidia bacterium]